jgi:hypothetical protein
VKNLRNIVGQTTPVRCLLVSNLNSDSALLELAQLRNLERPEHGDIEYLRLWLGPEIGGRHLEEKDRVCWFTNDNDLVSIQSQLRRENNIIMGIKMAFYIIYWKIWKHPKVKNGILKDFLSFVVNFKRRY